MQTTCPILTEDLQFTFQQEETLIIKTNFTCASQNLIYLLTCSGCNQNYMGQRGFTLRHRVTLHKEQTHFSQYSQIVLSEHIDRYTRNETPNFRIFPLYQCKHLQECLNKEDLFIQKV